LLSVRDPATPLTPATSATATPRAPEGLSLPDGLRIEFGNERFTGLQARQLDNSTLGAGDGGVVIESNGTASSTRVLSASAGSITPAPSAPAAPSIFVTTEDGEAYTFAGPDLPYPSYSDQQRCQTTCTIRVDDICKTIDDCVKKADKLAKRLCEVRA
jgi:hypothetical protein